MKNPNLIISIFWLGGGLLLSIWSTSYPIGTLTQPGSGAFPLGLGFLSIFLSLVLLAQGQKSSPDTKTARVSFTSRGLKKVGAIAIVLLAAAFFFEAIGYLATVLLLMVFLMKIAGIQSWTKIIFIALLSALAVYFIFVFSLNQPLPRGLLGI